MSHTAGRAFCLGDVVNEFVCFLDVLYSSILPSVEMVTTCQGMNFPLAFSASVAACSMPPQQGTSMRTMVRSRISFLEMISVSFSV